MLFIIKMATELGWFYAKIDRFSCKTLLLSPRIISERNYFIMYMSFEEIEKFYGLIIVEK